MNNFGMSGVILFVWILVFSLHCESPFSQASGEPVKAMNRNTTESSSHKKGSEDGKDTFKRHPSTGHQKYADEVSSHVASTWFELLYDIVKAERTAPPQASRIYGITAVALYESIVAGTKKNRSLAGQLNDLSWVPQPKKNKDHHWPTAANFAIANTVRGLFPTISLESLTAINELEQQFASQFRAKLSNLKYERSATHGEAVATAILEWAESDGLSIYNNCPYLPLQMAGGWEPTPPAFNPNPLQPCWGLIRPMALTSGDECSPRGPPVFSNDAGSAFFAAALEVYNVVLGLTDEQKTIADYWADGAGATGTPPGHWIAIASQIARQDRLSLAAAAEAYARVGIAVHDAFIGCWNAKYAYNLQRPVTYINDNIDGSWLPYIVTPNFPSYASGHSTQSGAAAHVLTDMFGLKQFTDTTHSDHSLVPPQEPRVFDSFHEAAIEAALSRLYGGIHYSFDNDDGLASGECIGQIILNRVKFKVGHHAKKHK
jgi:membrane-associated phospholipid phosphatase